MYVVGNWSDGLREILRCCYEHHGLNPDTYIQEDPQDSCADTSVLPEELRPLPPPINLPAGRLMPDIRRQLRSYGSDERGTEGEEATLTRIQAKGKGVIIHSAKSLHHLL